MSIGSRLKDARLQANLTREELADLVGVTKSAIGNYETDVSSPKETVFIKLLEVLHIDANYVFQDMVDLPAYHRAPTLTASERRLLSAWRAATPSAQEIALETLENHPAKQDAELLA